MNKTQLADKVYGVLTAFPSNRWYGDYTRKGAGEMVDSIFASIVNELAKGEQVSIAKFGIFEPKKRVARMGRNPKTGEPVQISSRVLPKFRPSEAFKRRVN